VGYSLKQCSHSYILSSELTRIPATKFCENSR
jgi:hypothetical protein